MYRALTNMTKLHIGTKTLLRIFNSPRNLILSPKEYKVSGVQSSPKFGSIEISPFYLQKLDDSFLETGIRSFLEPETDLAELVIERVYANEKHNVECILKERELRVILTNV